MAQPFLILLDLLLPSYRYPIGSYDSNLSRSLLTIMDCARLLSELITRGVDSTMIRHLAAAADNVLPFDGNKMPVQSGKAARPTSLTTSPIQVRAVQPQSTLPTVEQFIWKLVRLSNAKTATLLPTLVYIDRLKSRLEPMSRRLPCAPHRIFLTCLILAAKYFNDSSPRNKRWVRYATLDGLGFCISEVNLMERQLLYLFDWDLSVEEADLYKSWAGYIATARLGPQG